MPRQRALSDIFPASQIMYYVSRKITDILAAPAAAEHTDWYPTFK